MNLKKIVRRQLEKRLDRKYEKELKRRKLDYTSWLAELESKQKGMPYGKGAAADTDFTLLVFGKGTVAAGAKERIAAFFAKYPETALLYGDEDVKTEKGVCGNPWLKPDWSPDAYLCRDYLGSVVAVRKQLFDKLTEQEKQEEGLCHDRLTELAGGFKRGCKSIGHLREIIFHREEVWQLPGEGRAGRRPESAQEAQEFAGGAQESARETQDCFCQAAEEKPMVSVIIPSKDNVSVLKQCLTTLCKTAQGIDYEIIIVDNGSCKHTRDSVSKEVEKINQDLTKQGPLKGAYYLYEPMEFNFSRMCNMGAERAKGNLLLFLNDDIEAVEQGWFEEMAAKALEPWAGAVGIKLWYPDSDRIQHAGVVNISLGPVHKLQFLKDNKRYYDGRNIGVWNALAVTGACFMLRKTVFDEAGGFAENIQVAFNDVDLCFTLYEMGLHNVVVNTRHMLHHESLSRGNDETEEKQKRLLRERNLLYGRHPGLEGKDPYYHPWLNCNRLDTTIRPAFEEGRTIPDTRDYKLLGSLQGARRDDCLRLAFELTTAYRTQGYAVVLGSDNACFEKELLFKEKHGSNKLYRFAFTGQYRSDLEENMPDQKNIALSGFKVDFARSLPPGEYRIGAMATDKISGLTIVNWVNHTLTVQEA